MHRKKYGDITISNITTEADLTRRTFYAHFKTKDEVLEKYLDEKAKVFTPTIYANLLWGVFDKWIDNGMKESTEELSEIYNNFVTFCPIESTCKNIAQMLYLCNREFI